eukprot:TRINITY_DN2645_c0_g2_i1.p1 TRINITY_DN2645_c0_g2~~TRINITY_DN2645_c0_g2_i1.p1  ORF type:complete len:582 (+),score=100.45 TRINITY_DN2645_c0_g2_i1:355-2100(+)
MAPLRQDPASPLGEGGSPRGHRGCSSPGGRARIKDRGVRDATISSGSTSSATPWGVVGTSSRSDRGRRALDGSSPSSSPKASSSSGAARFTRHREISPEHQTSPLSNFMPTDDADAKDVAKSRKDTTPRATKASNQQAFFQAQEEARKVVASGLDVGGRMSVGSYVDGTTAFPPEDSEPPPLEKLPSKKAGMSIRFSMASMSSIDSDWKWFKKARESAMSMVAFPDHDEVKATVKKSIAKREPYNVMNFYCKRGLYQFIARHRMFENFTLFVISLNAFWMWIDTDFNTQKELFRFHPVFQVMEHFFCIYFSTEWYIRFRAFHRKCHGLRDYWFVFDSLLVLMMVLETWVFSFVVVARGSGGSPLGGNTAIVRLFRLMRLSRLVRMLRSMPELMILVKGMITAMKSVCYVMFLLIVVVYIFGIAMTQASVGEPFHDAYFSSVPYSMYSLLIYGTFVDNLAEFLNEMMFNEGYLCLTIALVFILLACITILNMLIGILCEVVSSTAECERLDIMTANLTDKLSSIIATIDVDYNGMISMKEFRSILECPSALEALQSVDVDPIMLVDFADTLFLNVRYPGLLL